MIDRLLHHKRPSVWWPLLHQRWHRLLFLHWRLAPDEVRKRVPASLEMDLFDGAAWVSVVAFTISRMRPSLLPPIPGLSDAQQINVRTYVRVDGIRALWFFSLDADNALAVWAARTAYRLPYYRARIAVAKHDDSVTFRCVRAHAGAPEASFDAAWELGAAMPSPRPRTIESFLLDRYVLYAGAGAGWRARIRHRPWPLREATLARLSSTMLDAAGLATLDEPALIHAQAVPFDVAIGPPERAAD